MAVKDSASKGVFSSILPVKAKRFEMAEPGESTNGYRTGGTTLSCVLWFTPWREGMNTEK